MKKSILVILALFASINAFATPPEELATIKAIEVCGEVRLLGSISTLLQNYLEGEWLASIDEKNGNNTIEIKIKYNGWTKWHTRPADLTLTISKRGRPDSIKIHTQCKVEVNDGGHQTIKYSCIKKLAKLIESNIYF